jgi:septum formation protein
MPTDAEERDDPIPAAIQAALPPLPLALADHPTLRAWRKAQAIWQDHPAAVVLGADTIVVLDQTVLNKPDNPAHARAMLSQLAARSHTVYTGLCICHDHPASPRFDLVASHVTLPPLTAEDIDAYVATGDPLDKAGGYGIQGLDGRLVAQVAGSYTAVVGLPLSATWRLLAAAGIAPQTDPAQAYETWLRNQRKEPLPCPPTEP